jgi:hypothetical protein
VSEARASVLIPRVGKECKLGKPGAPEAGPFEAKDLQKIFEICLMRKKSFAQLYCLTCSLFLFTILKIKLKILIFVIAWQDAWQNACPRESTFMVVFHRGILAFE